MAQGRRIDYDREPRYETVLVPQPPKQEVRTTYVETPSTYILELSKDEAQAIMETTARVGGGTTNHKMIGQVAEALRSMGLSWHNGTMTGAIYFTDRKDNGSKANLFTV